MTTTAELMLDIPVYSSLHIHICAEDFIMFVTFVSHFYCTHMKCSHFKIPSRNSSEFCAKPKTSQIAIYFFRQPFKWSSITSLTLHVLHILLLWGKFAHRKSTVTVKRVDNTIAQLDIARKDGFIDSVLYTLYYGTLAFLLLSLVFLWNLIS